MRAAVAVDPGRTGGRAVLCRHGAGLQGVHGVPGAPGLAAGDAAASARAAVSAAGLPLLAREPSFRPAVVRAGAAGAAAAPEAARPGRPVPRRPARGRGGRHQRRGHRPRERGLLAPAYGGRRPCLADACRAHEVTELVVSGGGARNPVLMRMIAEELPGVPLRPSDDLGMPSGAKEALAFAVLGFLTAHGLPGSLPSATGARRAAVLGSITPGRSPLRLPEPAAQPPRLLRIVR